MVKVLIVANNLNPVDGGISTFIMNEFSFIDRNKVHIDFVIHEPQKDHIKKYIKDNGSELYQISPFNPIRYRAFWKRFLKEHHDYDIIHVHSFDPTILYLRLAKKYGITTIVHSHTTNMPRFDLVDRICRLNQFGSRFVADYFFGCSHRAIRDRFGKKIERNTAISRMIPNGINTDKFRFNPISRNSIREELGLNNKIVVGNVGRFEYQKNQVFAIKAFSCFKKKYPDSVLLLIGGGIDEGKIKDEIHNERLEDSVLLLGIKKNVPDFLSAFDIFLFPSFYEGLSIALVEAQCSGLQCVVSSEAVDNESDMGCGLLHRISLQKSPEFWAETMLDVSAEINDENRIIFADKVKDHGFDMKESVKVLENFYVEHSKKNQI